MAIEINLATYDKQEEILSNLGGGATFMYMLAKSDSTASQSDIESLKEIPHIKNIVNSSTAMGAVVNSRIAMEAVANSSTAMEAVINSSTAMEAVANSSTAMNIVKTNSVAIAKIVAKLAGLNTSDYANMEAVAKSSTAMEAVINSSTAMEAVINSSTAMEAVAKSSTAMRALLNSKNAKTLEYNTTITGKFLPLKSTKDSNYLQAYNGTWSNIGIRLGDWLLRNSSKPIATQIKRDYNAQTIYYYDLNA